MAYDVRRTTAEHIVGATDAAVQSSSGATIQLVSEFLDCPEWTAETALIMAEQLELLSSDGRGRYKPVSMLARYLVTSSDEQKAAILRIVVEAYQPYRTFKERLALTGSTSDSAKQTKALYALAQHHDDIALTFSSVGTFTNSLRTEPAGKVSIGERSPEEYAPTLAGVVQEREGAEMAVRTRLGPEVADWCDRGNIIIPLVDGYHALRHAGAEPRSPIVHAANGFESFLVQIGREASINLARQFGINAKAEELKRNNKLTKKHLNIAKYLGHVRNAADHGTDDEIGQMWTIRSETPFNYVAVTLMTVSTVADAHINRRFAV